MTPDQLKAFKKLCESVVNEASQLPNIIKSRPNGNLLIKHLHKVQSLPHDATFQPVDKILWNDLKETGGWALFIGNTGIGGLHYIKNKDQYEVLSVTKEGSRQFINTKGGNIIDYLKKEIGGIYYMFVSTSSSIKPQQDKEDKKTVRDKRDATNFDDEYQRIILRLAPIFHSMVTKAQNEIKGVAINAIKNGNFSIVKKKLKRLEDIDDVISKLESGDSKITDPYDNRIRFFDNKLSNSIKKVYADVKPDLVDAKNNGEIHLKDYKDYRTFIKSAISDPKLLSSILGYLRQEILR